MEPYEKILELVETKRLDITTVSLAQVTDDFIKYLNNPETNIEPAALADFIAVAARLILIKSKTLLPSLELTEEEQSDVKELEERLKLYREFRTASVYIKNLWQKRRSFSRDYLNYASQEIIFSEPAVWRSQQKIKLTGAHLLETLRALIAEAEELLYDKKSIKIKMVSLEEKIKELWERFKSYSTQKFSQLAAGKSRSEIVATFLAILHLIKEQKININQPKVFEEIIIEKC